MACGFDALADRGASDWKVAVYAEHPLLNPEPNTYLYGFICTALSVYIYTVIYFPNLKYPLHFLSELQLHLLSRGFGINMLNINLRPLKDIFFDPLCHYTPYFIKPLHVTLLAFVCGIQACIYAYLSNLPKALLF